MDTSGLTQEQVASLTDEDIKACAAAHWCEESVTLDANTARAWRGILLNSHESDWPKAVAKAREILAARAMSDRCANERCTGQRQTGSEWCSLCKPQALHGDAKPTIAGYSLDGVRVSFNGVPLRGVKESGIVSEAPKAPSLPDAADSLFRFLCGLDGTVTARWLSVADQREFERLRRGLGEALMAVGRGRR